MISNETREKWDIRIELVLEKSERLNERETEFVDSIQLQRSQGRDLSVAQVAWLYDLYNKLCG